MIALVVLLFVAAFLLVLFDMRRGARRPANAAPARGSRRTQAHAKRPPARHFTGRKPGKRH